MNEPIADLWRDNAIQFPRLLAEINAVGLTDIQINLICESMDVVPDEIGELFERAEAAWERIKARL